MEKASKSTTAASQQAATQSGGVQVSTQTPTAASSTNLEANKAKDKGGVKTLFGSLMSRSMLIARNAIADRKSMVDAAIAQLEGKGNDFVPGEETNHTCPDGKKAVSRSWERRAAVPPVKGTLTLDENSKPVLAVPVSEGSIEITYVQLPKRVTDSLRGAWHGDTYIYHHQPEDDPWNVRILRAIGPVGRVCIDLLVIIAMITCWVLCASPIGQILCGAALLFWVFKGYELALLPAPIKEEMDRLTRIPKEWQKIEVTDKSADTTEAKVQEAKPEDPPTTAETTPAMA